MISTSAEDIHCDEHKNNDEDIQCDVCQSLREKVIKYQTHGHTFTCAKKRKTLTIKENDGHGRFHFSL